MPTELSGKNEFILSSLNGKYKYNYFKDYENLSPSGIDIKYKEKFNLDDSWNFYNTNFKVINNFYFKFELNMQKIFNNNIFFRIDSDRNDHFILNHIVKLSNSFIIKIFYVSKNSKTTTNIFRTSIHYDDNSDNFAFIYEKNLNSVRLKIKSRKQSIKRVFSINDFTFLSFGYFLNDSNKLALSSIYFTDTYNLDKSSENDAKIFQKCSKQNFKSFSCVSKDIEFCQTLYCKICCKKTLRYINSIEKCQANCITSLKYNLV